MQSTSMVLIAVCLFATVYSALGMRTVYYRDGRICDVCTDNYNRDDVVPYKQSYTPEEAGKRVIYSGGQDRINSRPIISPSSSSSSSYIVDRGDYSSRQACYPNPCGVNANCRDVGRPVCSCPAGYRGNPLISCIRSECLDHIECPAHLHCRNGNCENPCIGQCGVNADCTVRNHIPVCSCPGGFRGDPFTSCRRADPEEACHAGGRWGPCGQNTKCEVIGGVPTCSCLKGFVGSAITGCRHECESDYECGTQHLCKDFRCQPACNECGIGADCRVSNHRPVCECPKNYYGNPLVECRAECYGDRDCPAGRPACIYGVCKNPCDGACGVNADCNLRGLTPVCSCPRTHTGNPFVSCRPFTPEDLCTNNPCGTNAQCRPGHDNTGAERPVCTCLPGYTGNPLTHCARGECQSDSECSDSRACINYSCIDPCIGQCGANAICEAQRHIAVCKCPQGYDGNAASSCVRQSRAYYPFSRYYKKK